MWGKFDTGMQATAWMREKYGPEKLWIRTLFTQGAMSVAGIANETSETHKTHMAKFCQNTRMYWSK